MQCPVVLLVVVSLRIGKALGNGKVKFKFEQRREV
jgi:hypothetical protein